MVNKPLFFRLYLSWGYRGTHGWPRFKFWPLKNVKPGELYIHVNLAADLAGNGGAMKANVLCQNDGEELSLRLTEGPRVQQQILLEDCSAETLGGRGRNEG